MNVQKSMTHIVTDHQTDQDGSLTKSKLNIIQNKCMDKERIQMTFFPIYIICASFQKYTYSTTTEQFIKVLALKA